MRHNLYNKMLFKHELKYSKRSGHVTGDVEFFFGCYKNYHVEHYFPANICRVMKRRLSTVVSLVSRLFNNNDIITFILRG